MKAFLMHPDRDFDPGQDPPAEALELVADLELDVLFRAMAGGDPFLLDVANKAVLSMLGEVAEIRYRQDVLRDCIANAATVRRVYALCVSTIEREKKNYWGVHSRSPGYLLHRSIEVLQMFVEALRRLRGEAKAHQGEFVSEGFANLFAMLCRELDDDYLSIVEDHLARLKFRRGVLISVRLGSGNAGIGHVLRRPNDDDRPWLRRVLAREPYYTFHIAERDEGGARAVEELRNRGINLVANATAQSNDHILGFFRTLRTELAFYVGCLNLYDTLRAKSAPASFPLPVPRGERRYKACGLYDVCLALSLDRPVVGNEVEARERDLVVITGANQGGKSTFLRSVGVAQLMMQCGMFVPARSFCANLCAGLFTHFKREEDATMRSGKFDEELLRASAIVDRLAPDCIVLFNESFQSTNEREGSEIGFEIVRALLEARIGIFFVTHMYDLASRCRERLGAAAMFLRAERRADGTRTFRVVPGAPLPTSYGRDLYDRSFSEAAPEMPGDGSIGAGPDLVAAVPASPRAAS